MFTALRAGIVSTIDSWLAPRLTMKHNDVKLALSINHSALEISDVMLISKYRPTIVFVSRATM